VIQHDAIGEWFRINVKSANITMCSAARAYGLRSTPSMRMCKTSLICSSSHFNSSRSRLQASSHLQAVWQSTAAVQGDLICRVSCVDFRVACHLGYKNSYTLMSSQNHNQSLVTRAFLHPITLTLFKHSTWLHSATLALPTLRHSYPSRSPFWTSSSLALRLRLPLSGPF
jgi:hypothetical protein